MIETVTVENLKEVLPLMRLYQEFYEVPDISDERNYQFFAQFGGGNEKGCLFAFRQNERIVAFATVYFCFTSTIVSEVAVLNDLYTLPEYRRRGIGRKLIEHCWQYGKAHGAARLQWVTAPGNLEAQALYKSMGAKQSSWEFFTYAT
jgi:ribosomal protein S18 acetylase RimI-like enzyme